MISAPERTTEMNIDELATQEMVFAEPHVRTQGHLALVSWAAPTPLLSVTVKPQFLKDPVVKSAADRWFERSVFLLMASSIAAIGACFLHL